MQLGTTRLISNRAICELLRMRFGSLLSHVPFGTVADEVLYKVIFFVLRAQGCYGGEVVW